MKFKLCWLFLFVVSILIFSTFADFALQFCWLCLSIVLTLNATYQTFYEIFVCENFPYTHFPEICFHSPNVRHEYQGRTEYFGLYTYSRIGSSTPPMLGTKIRIEWYTSQESFFLQPPLTLKPHLKGAKTTAVFLYLESQLFGTNIRIEWNRFLSNPNSFLNPARRAQRQQLYFCICTHIHTNSNGFWQIGPRTIGPQSAGPRTDEPQTAGPRTVGPRTDGPQTAGPRTVGPWTDVKAQLSVFQGRQLGFSHKNQDRIKNVELYTHFRNALPPQGPTGPKDNNQSW